MTDPLIITEVQADRDEFRVIVAGGRDFDDYDLMNDALNHYLDPKLDTHRVVIVSGTAAGADTLGERWAQSVYCSDWDPGLEVRRFAADWDRYGRSAGYRRNEVMASEADALVAFWDGQSRGTKHMIDIATREGLSVRIVRY